eukprot:293137_1
MAAASSTTALDELLSAITEIIKLKGQWTALKSEEDRKKRASKRKAKGEDIRAEMQKVYDNHLASGKSDRNKILGVKISYDPTRKKIETAGEPLFEGAKGLLQALDQQQSKKWPYRMKDDMTPWTNLQAALSDISKAQSGFYNELDLFDDSFDYQYHDRIGSGRSLPFDDHNRYQPLISEEYNDVSGSGSPLLIGGVVGASAVVIIMLIFCLGLAFGMIIYWGCTQKKALEKKRNKEEM